MIPTRGERNNNPGNIERNDTHWRGMAVDQSSDPRFVVFILPSYGIRALAKVLLTYSKRYEQGTAQDIDTVREIINRWAPPKKDGVVENDTESYVDSVARNTGFSPDDVIEVADPSTLFLLVKAIINHENGRVVYNDSIIEKSIKEALL